MNFLLKAIFKLISVLAFVKDNGGTQNSIIAVIQDGGNLPLTASPP